MQYLQKVIEICILIKILTKHIFKNISTNVSGKYSPTMLAKCQKSLDYPKPSVTLALKTTSKTFKTQEKRLLISLVIKLLANYKSLEIFIRR